MNEQRPQPIRYGAKPNPPDYGTVQFEDDEEHEIEPRVEEPHVDMTQSLPLRSKRTERQRKKSAKRSLRAATVEPGRGLFDLPYELLFPIVCLLQPRDIIVLLRVSKPLRRFILSEEDRICQRVIRMRYDCLAKCFRRPALMDAVDAVFHPGLQSPDRPEMALNLHKRGYQHIRAPDTSIICTCLTCVLRWNSLCIAVDFAYWQKNLDKGEPIPIVPRGGYPEWNQKLLRRNADIVEKSLHSRLFYTRILGFHLASIVGSIQRHAQNKGNRRRRFRMTDDDVRRGTADFLERSGPPTIDLPYHRDNYYMLEAFLPNRSWITERNEWVYVPDEQHDKDLKIALRWEAWSKRQRTATSIEHGSPEPGTRTTQDVGRP